MSAEILREAAALMRERVNRMTNVSEGAWGVEDQCFCDVYDDAMERGGCNHRAFRYALRVPGKDISSHAGGEFYHRPIAEHGASWHPAVALAVANWLENEHEACKGWDVYATQNALNVARAYLGRDQ